MKRLAMALGVLVLQNLCVFAAQSQFSYGINIDVQDDDGQTALMKAAEYGHTELVAHLIKQDANLNLADCYGNTALIKASIHGYCDIVQLLIEAKAKLMRRNKLGGTALIEAATFGQCEVVKLLIPAIKAAYEANADLDVSYMNVDDLRQLMLRELLRPLDVQDNSGCTALMQAAVHGYTQIVALLIDAGADPLVKDNEGCTARVLVQHRLLKNKNEVLAVLQGETVQPILKKRRVYCQRKSKANI